MNTNKPNSTTTKLNQNSRASTTSGATSAEVQQVQQRLWVKEQEVSALKVQNRHLIAKLEEAEKSAEPNKINTQKIATEIQNQLRPLIGEIEKSLTESFDILKGTMRGIYQQSQRAQQAVEDIGAHSREIELRTNEQRKADQVYYQEKILSMVTSFGERIERQLENRLRSLAVVELMNTKQNEVLADVEMLKSSLASLVVSNENLRSEIKTLIKDEAIRNFSESRDLKNEVNQEAKIVEKILKEQKNSGNATENVPSIEKQNSPRITLDYL
jgi:regulator of replication initiation timing